MTALPISNSDARRLFLHRHALDALHEKNTKADDTLALIERLGFVQLDSINTVERAHHMILFSRAPQYQREHLSKLHHEQAALFEHWTHDASLIPMGFYPYWHQRFLAARLRINHPRWQERLGADGEKAVRNVRARIKKEGPLMARDFEDKGKGAWWGWGPSKTALEYLWRTGELAIARREGFEKVYDLSERVIPDELRNAKKTPQEITEWACRAALDRLGVATPQELAAFWNLVSIADAKAWCESTLKQGQLVKVKIEGHDGKEQNAIAAHDIEDRLLDTPSVQNITRFLSPFDPAIRDRKRAMRLFGFDYRIEVFVPEAKRRYGYYVLPLLEGDRFIGRADMKAHRAEGRLEMKNIWLEPGIRLTKAREKAVRQSLASLARFTGTEEMDVDAALQRAKAG